MFDQLYAMYLIKFNIKKMKTETETLFARSRTKDRMNREIIYVAGI